jgi:hypothetical protein
VLEVGWFSTKLMLKGKLLRNPGYFFPASSHWWGDRLALARWHGQSRDKFMVASNVI